MRMNEAAGGRQDDSGEQARAYLRWFLQENAAQLQAIICGYVAKMGLATGAHIQAVAAEVFQDAALEALAHADRFHPQMQPRAWFLAIAANILKRYRASVAKRARFEVLVGSLARRSELEPEQDVLDRLMACGAPGLEQAVTANEGARELLALISPQDAQLLKQALIDGWDARMLASMMGVSPGTARVRVHRALSRLRKAWQQSEQRKEREKRNG